MDASLAQGAVTVFTEIHLHQLILVFTEPLVPLHQMENKTNCGIAPFCKAMYILDKEMSKTESSEMPIKYLLYLVVVTEVKWVS